MNILFREIFYSAVYCVCKEGSKYCDSYAVRIDKKERAHPLKLQVVQPSKQVTVFVDNLQR